MNQWLPLAALIILGIAGITALVMGENDVTLFCLGAVVGVLAPTDKILPKSG